MYRPSGALGNTIHSEYSTTHFEYFTFANLGIWHWFEPPPNHLDTASKGSRGNLSGHATPGDRACFFCYSILLFCFFVFSSISSVAY